MKSNFTKLILVLMLFVTAFTFCACSTVESVTIYNQDGSIEERVNVSLDKAEILAAGEDFDEVKQFAEEVSNKYARLLVTDYMLANSILDADTDIISVLLVDWSTETDFTVGIKFKDKNVYYDYYGITEQNTAQNQVERHYFYNKIYQTGNTIYVSANTLYNSIKEEVLSEYPSFVKVQNNLKFTLITDSKRTHSDADSVSYVNGEYYHTWNVKEGEFDKEITIYWLLANRGHCILVCLLIGISVCAILCAIGAVILNKQKKNKNLGENIKNDTNC